MSFRQMQDTTIEAVADNDQILQRFPICPQDVVCQLLRTMRKIKKGQIVNGITTFKILFRTFNSQSCQNFLFTLCQYGIKNNSLNTMSLEQCQKKRKLKLGSNLRTYGMWILREIAKSQTNDFVDFFVFFLDFKDSRPSSEKVLEKVTLLERVLSRFKLPAKKQIRDGKNRTFPKLQLQSLLYKSVFKNKDFQ